MAEKSAQTSIHPSWKSFQKPIFLEWPPINRARVFVPLTAGLITYLAFCAKPMREDVVDILPNSNVQLATMDAKQTNSCKYRKSMGYAPQRLNSHHLSRTQSGLSEPEVRQSTPPDHPNITRRHSLSMPSDQSCPVVLSLRRKPNFTIRFPALRISPPVSAIKGVSRQRLSPAASATVGTLSLLLLLLAAPSYSPN